MMLAFEEEWKKEEMRQKIPIDQLKDATKLLENDEETMEEHVKAKESANTHLLHWDGLEQGRQSEFEVLKQWLGVGEKKKKKRKKKPKKKKAAVVETTADKEEEEEEKCKENEGLASSAEQQEDTQHNTMK